MAEIIASSGTPNPDKGPASSWIFSNRAFDMLFAGSLAGTFGDRLYQMACIVAVMLAFRDSSSQVAAITLAGVVPQFFLYPLIGSLIDTLDRRLLLWGSCALKIVLVLLFALAFRMDLQGSFFHAHWSLVLLPVVFLLSLVTVPFGPARAAAIPDVAEPHQTGIAASLLATTGLVSILLGTLAGGYLAQLWGPLPVIFLASGLYFLATVPLRLLPGRVAVPGTQRAAADGTPPKTRAAAGGIERLRGYARETWEGLRYCQKKRGVAGLILFEATFWVCAVSFYTLLPWHASLVLQLPAGERVMFFSVGLGLAGVGLFGGALVIGKFCKRISPLFSYPPAYLLIGWALTMIFAAQGRPNPERALLEFSERYQKKEVLAEFRKERQARYRAAGLDAGAAAGKAAQDTARRRELAAQLAPDQARRERIRAIDETGGFTRDPRSGKKTFHRGNVPLARSLFFALFLLGLGGGLLLGRVDADMLNVIDEPMRGRVFSIKGFFFTGALLAPLILFTFNKAYDTRLLAAHYLPPVMLWGAIPVIAVAWLLDCGLYAERTDTGEVGWQERIFYRGSRFLCWLICKLYFRYTVIGAEKIPKQGPVILAANHGSFLDPIWLGIGTRRRVQYIMHRSYYRSLAHPFFRLLNNVPVDSDSQIRALKSGARVLAQGICVGMFPEGHVSDDGALQKPKSGVLFLAQRSGAVVVPVAIQGNTNAFPRRARFPRPRKITARVGEPFRVPRDASRLQIAARTDEMMAEIATVLELEVPPACAADLPKRHRRGGPQEAREKIPERSVPEEEGNPQAD